MEVKKVYLVKGCYGREESAKYMVVGKAGSQPGNCF